MCAPVVEGDADVQIKVAVAHGRRAREFIFHLGDLQADASEPLQDVEQVVSGLTQNRCPREILNSMPQGAAIIVLELLQPLGSGPLVPGSERSPGDDPQRFNQNLLSHCGLGVERLEIALALLEVRILRSL